MQFTLITKNGKVMQFFIGAVAETYQQIYGGVIVTSEILNGEQKAGKSNGSASVVEAFKRLETGLLED